VRDQPLIAERHEISVKWRTPAILLAVILAGVAASGLSASVRAAEWVVEGRAALRGEFEDNITLDPDDELSDFSATFSPEVGIGGRSDNWDLFLKTRLDFVRFATEDSQDSEDIRVALETSYRTQLSVWELDAIFRRATPRTTELTDTGRLDVDAERIDFEILPSWSYVLTPRDSIILGAGWQRADFDVSTLDDFTTYFASGGWRHQLTEQDDITLTGFASHFENDDVSGNESDTIGAQLEWHRVYSERLETRIAIGPRYTDSDTTVLGVKDSDTSVGVIVDGEVNYDLDERTTISANVSQSVDPSGGGTAVERALVGLSVRYEYEPEIVLGLSTRYQKDKDPNDRDSVDRKYFTIEPGISWQFKRDWFLTGGYRFRTQELAGESRASSNTVFVTLSYEFPKWTFAN